MSGKVVQIGVSSVGGRQSEAFGRLIRVLAQKTGNSEEEAATALHAAFARAERERRENPKERWRKPTIDSEDEMVEFMRTLGESEDFAHLLWKRFQSKDSQ